MWAGDGDRVGAGRGAGCSGDEMGPMIVMGWGEGGVTSLAADSRSIGGCVGGVRAGEMLAANLRARRDEQGISLSELARRSGIAKGTLSQLESGTGNPTIETVFSLSNALGLPVSALL